MSTPAQELALMLEGDATKRATRVQPSTSSASLELSDFLTPEPAADHKSTGDQPLGFLDGEVLTSKACLASGTPPAEYLTRKGVMLTELGQATLELLNKSERNKLTVEARALGIDVGAVLEAAKTHLVMGRPLADPWEAVRGEIAMRKMAARHASSGKGGAGSSVRGL